MANNVGLDHTYPTDEGVPGLPFSYRNPLYNDIRYFITTFVIIANFVIMSIWSAQKSMTNSVGLDHTYPSDEGVHGLPFSYSEPSL